MRRHAKVGSERALADLQVAIVKARERGVSMAVANVEKSLVIALLGHWGCEGCSKFFAGERPKPALCPECKARTR